MNAVQTLCARWLEEATDPLPPETPASVQATFSRLGFTATSDVLALYGIIGGMRVMDNEYWRLWSLDEIAEQEPSEAGIVFSDYCISCWDFRLKPISAEKSAVFLEGYDGKPPRLVASSLEEFFERYAIDPDSVLVAPNA